VLICSENLFQKIRYSHSTEHLKLIKGISHVAQNTHITTAATHNQKQY